MGAEMKLWITLEGRDAEVEFRTEGNTLWLELEGRRIEADFHRLPGGEVYSLIVNGRSHEVRVSPARGRVDVTLGGATFPVEVRHPLERSVQSAERTHAAGVGETVLSPMPGLVVAIKVKPSEPVARGQAVAVIEAMKMQNELSAHHGGVVAEVLVSPGDTVAAGQPLLRLRPEGS
jgi:biotin carboxyl carrier protein